MIGTLERVRRDGETDVLELKLNGEKGITLRRAIDRSELMEFPSIFTIESTLSNRFIIFGGEKTYWLSLTGGIVLDLELFRRCGEEEYNNR